MFILYPELNSDKKIKKTREQGSSSFIQKYKYLCKIFQHDYTRLKFVQGTNLSL